MTTRKRKATKKTPKQTTSETATCMLPPASWESRIRDALVASGRTSYDLNQACGVHAISIDRFRRGEKTLNLATAEKLARALGFQLVETRPRH